MLPNRKPRYRQTDQSVYQVEYEGLGDIICGPKLLCLVEAEDKGHNSENQEMLGSHLYLLSHQVRIDLVVLSKKLKHEFLLRERNYHIDKTDADKGSFSSRHCSQELLNGSFFLRLLGSHLFSWFLRLLNR